jgi:hypothetical protein
MVKVQVLVEHSSAEPVPPEKTPGIPGAATFEDRVRKVPGKIEKTQGSVPALQISPEGKSRVLPLASPSLRIVS